MSEELIVLKEYIQGLGFDPRSATARNLYDLRAALLDAGEFGLARFVYGLRVPEELMEYIGDWWEE